MQQQQEVGAAPIQVLEVLQGQSDRYLLYKNIWTQHQSSVYRAIAFSNGKEVVIKKIKKQVLNGDTSAKLRLGREIYFMGILKSPYFLRLREAFQIKIYDQDGSDMGYYCLVSDFCNGQSRIGEDEDNETGDLLQFYNRRAQQGQFLTQTQAIEIFKQIAIGFSEFHAHGIVHRDIKLENIFLHDGVVVIGDLGFAKEIIEDSINHTQLGTRTTRAPETLFGVGDYNPFISDIFQLGCVLYTLLAGNFPFYREGQNDIHLNQAIQKREYVVKLEQVTDDVELQKFIDKMLKYDQKDRMTLEEFYEHKIFRDHKDQFRYSSLLTEDTLQEDLNYVSQKRMLQNSEAIEVPTDSQLIDTITKLPDGKNILGTENTEVLSIYEKYKQQNLKEKELKNVLSLYINEVNILNQLLSTVNLHNKLGEDKIYVYHLLPTFMLLKRALVEYQVLFSKLNNREGIFSCKYPDEFFKDFRVQRFIQRLKIIVGQVAAKFRQKLEQLKKQNGWSQQELSELNDVYHSSFIKVYKQVLKAYIHKIRSLQQIFRSKGDIKQAQAFQLYAAELCNCALLHNYYRSQQIFDFIGYREKQRTQTYEARELEIEQKYQTIT